MEFDSSLSQTLVHNIDGPTLLGAIAALKSSVLALESKVAPPPQVEYMSRVEVSKLIKVSTVTVTDWRNKGILTSYKIGNQVRYKRHEVESALKEHRPKRRGNPHE